MFLVSLYELIVELLSFTLYPKFCKCKTHFDMTVTHVHIFYMFIVYFMDSIVSRYCFHL